MFDKCVSVCECCIKFVLQYLIVLLHKKQKVLFFWGWGANYPLKESSSNHDKLKFLCFLSSFFLLLIIIYFKNNIQGPGRREALLLRITYYVCERQHFENTIFELIGLTINIFKNPSLIVIINLNWHIYVLIYKCEQVITFYV